MEISEEKKYTYKEMKRQMNDMIEHNYPEFVKAVVSIEKDIDDEKVLDKVYDQYRENDGLISILGDEFEEFIEVAEEDLSETVDVLEEEVEENLEVAEEFVLGDSEHSRRKVLQRLQQQER